MTVLTLFFLGTFILSGSAWLIQKPFIRPLSNTCRFYGPGDSSRATITTNELVVPGITLPFAPATLNAIAEFTSNKTQNGILQIWTGIAIKEGNFTGESKSDPKALDKLQKIYIDSVVKNKQHLPDNYKFFGNGNVEEILKQLLLTNPFFTSALQHKEGTWKISTYAKNENPTRYSKLITAYDKTFPRVNVELSIDLKVTSFKVFDFNGNEITSKYDRLTAIKLLIFTMTYYSEIVHPSTHIFDYISVLGLFSSTAGANSLVANWANSYFSNVPKKYLEVEELLFSENGVLVSPAGLNANRTEVLQFITDEILKTWLHYSSADEFVNNFIFAYIPPAQRRIFLTAFRDQVGLVPSFAEELSSAIKDNIKDNKANYDTINQNLERYYSSLGNDISNIKDLRVWIELMSVIGILHGSTFSFSRYVATADFLPYIRYNPENKYIDLDLYNAVSVLATTLGLSSDRYVFTSNLCDDISGVLQKYDKKTNELKVEHLKTIMKEKEKFADYGWIWTDFGPDLIDNKQLTLATYV